MSRVPPVAPGPDEPRAVLPQWPATEEARAAAARLGSAEAHVARVLEVAGARPLALDAFLRVSRVEWSDEVATACIECADRPRLLLNAAFVEARCHTPERLAALLLHELAHVSMGHTRLFPRPTFAHNVACDAIINREIAALAADCGADGAALLALFIECYPAHDAPWFLLRPPPGWPQAPRWTASAGAPAVLRDLHRRLYDTSRADRRHGVQYGELVDALREAGAAGGDALPGALLGAHGATPAEQAALSGGRDTVGGDVFAESLRRMSGHLAGAGGALSTATIAPGRRRAALERALRDLLARCFGVDGRRASVAHDERPARTVLPHHDRRASARLALARAFGAPRPLLFDDHTPAARPQPRHATIYLDVSGSMHDMLPALHAALVPLRRVLRPRLLLFSTTVIEASAADFDAGRLTTTGGTDIAPVLEHLLGVHVEAGRKQLRPRARRALLITDGYFDPPRAALRRALRDHGVQVHVAIAGSGPLSVNAWAASGTRLPNL